MVSVTVGVVVVGVVSVAVDAVVVASAATAAFGAPVGAEMLEKRGGEEEEGQED